MQSFSGSNSDSCSQYYSNETAEFCQHPYDVEFPGLFHPSLSQPMQQQPPNFMENLFMETTTAVCPSTNSEMQLEYNSMVTADTNDDWMKELNAAEELLMCQEPERNDDMSSNVDSSSLITEPQQIIEGRRMKELNAVEESLMCPEPESNYNMSSNVDSSSFTTELQQIIEGSSCSQNYSNKTAEFWQHPYDVEYPGLFHPSLSQPTQQQPPNLVGNLAMETTLAVFPSTNPGMQPVYNNIVKPDTNDDWMKEVNAVEELLMCQEPESNYNMSSNVDSSTFTTELQQIIEGSSFQSPFDGSTGASVPIQDIRWDQAPKIIPETSYGSANKDHELHSDVAPPTDIASSPQGISKTHCQNCNCRMVKRRRKRTPSVNFASLIDKRVLSAGDKASYINKRSKRVSKQGWITREGIRCGCCSKVYNISMFEAHAGSGNHRPAANIFLDDGRCLLDLQINEDASL